MDLSFGLTMLIMGMGVTLLTLYLLTLIIRILLKLFPYQKVEASKTEKP